MKIRVLLKSDRMCPNVISGVPGDPPQKRELKQNTQ